MAPSAPDARSAVTVPEELVEVGGDDAQPAARGLDLGLQLRPGLLVELVVRVPHQALVVVRQLMLLRHTAIVLCGPTGVTTRTAAPYRAGKLIQHMTAR